MSDRKGILERLKTELPEDIELYSSANHLKRFKEDIGWQDIVRFLDDHILWCYKQLEEVDSPEDLRLYQGQIRMAKTVLGLPDHLIEQAELDQESEEQNNGTA